MIVNQDISLICPRNDLESATIMSVAKRIGIDVRESPQSRGGKLGNEPVGNLLGLKKTVVIVELPDPGTEEILRRQGHEVIVIDHHDAPGLNRWRPESSLEQFCELVGEPMADDLWKVAVNDRDFIPGLARMGVSYEEMEEIGSRERDATGVSALFQEAWQSLRIPLRRFEDLDLFIVPSRYDRVMGEVAQWPSKQDYDEGVKRGALRLRNCLILYYDDDNPDHIALVEYYGEGRVRRAFGELLGDKSLADFEMWAGGGEYNCFWGARPKYAKATPKRVDELVDRVLSFTLVSGRPLRQFHTTFLFPFRFKGNPAPKVDTIPWDPQRYSRQEIMFFLPQVRRIFFEGGDSKESAVQKWTLPVEEGESLVLYEKGDSEPIGVPIKEISLYRFFNGIHILSISTAQDTPSSFWDGRPLWKALTDPSFDSTCVTLTPTQTLIYNNLLRIVYCSYAEQKAEGKIANKVVWYRSQPVVWEPKDAEGAQQDISKVVTAIIGEFVGPGEDIDRDSLWDDRMFVHTCLAFSGSPPKHAPSEEIYHAFFTVATYVDKSGFDYLSGYPCDREFVKSLIEKSTYRRWYEVSGNLYSFTRYSAVFFGFEKFFHETVVGHVSTMYLRMSIIALFYRASLLYYGYRVAQIAQPESHKATDEAINAYQEELREIHWELTRFTNRYWFNELSSQDQPIEQFNLQTRAMDLKEQYARVKGDIERAYEALEMRSSYDLGRKSFWAAIAALIFTMLFLITAMTSQIPFWVVVLDSAGVVCGLIFIIFIAKRLLRQRRR